MVIGGFEKLSLLDYPDHLAAIIFTKACNFRCHFCYNPQLVLTDKSQNKEGFVLDEQGLLSFLESRRGKLDGVVISGGEPTLQPDLMDFIRKVKDMGYDIKLDTNGSNPEVLQSLLVARLIDYIAMDIKSGPTNYERVINVPLDYKKIEKSVKMIMTSGLPYEFRTTLVPGLIAEDDLVEMGSLIKGADKWYLQKFKADVDLVDSDFGGRPAYTSAEMKKFETIGSAYVNFCQVRG